MKDIVGCWLFILTVRKQLPLAGLFERTEHALIDTEQLVGIPSFRDTTSSFLCCTLYIVE